jgi:hypothetical protein
VEEEGVGEEEEDGEGEAVSSLRLDFDTSDFILWVVFSVGPFFIYTGRCS